MDLHCFPRSEPADSSRPFPFAVLLIAVLCLTLLPAAAIAQADDDIHRFNRDFQQLIATLYQTAAQRSEDQASAIDSLAALDTLLKSRITRQDMIGAAALLRTQRALLEDNIDDRLIFNLIRQQLELGDRSAARQMYDFIRREGEKSLLSNVAFIFAVDARRQANWPAVVEYSEGIYQDLAENDAAYAQLITGVALQHLKRHRKALDHYKQIPSTSTYYLAGQLNSAIAYLRQGWWSDARRTIDQAVQNPAGESHREMINRLNLVLGYAMLQQEYYRDARNAFRRIDLDSRYSNRALLGLALSAANQTDYIGALNALNRLREQSSIDLSVEESRLLLGYVYQKLEQQMTASASYSEAIEYYQARLDHLSGLAQRTDKTAALLDRIDSQRHLIQLDDTLISYADRYPPAFFTNLLMLDKLQNSLQQSSVSLPASLTQRLRALNRRGRAILQDVTEQLIAQRREYLNSYLSQCRYGLANLYDSALQQEP